MKKKAAKKKTTRRKTSSTPDANELLMGVVQPLIDFHKAVEGSSDEDLRIYWDVRIVQGADKPVARSTGSSSLPGAQSTKMMAHAPSLIQQEIMEKVAAPLSAKLQIAGEEANAVAMERLATSDTHRPVESGRSPGAGKVMDLAEGGVIEAETVEDGDDV